MSQPPGRERRRHPRLPQHLPVRVIGYAPNGSPWEESAVTRDISQGGLSLSLPRPSFKGQVLQLCLPLPRNLREFDRDAAELKVYAIVRGAVEGHGVCQLGVKFFGQHPPRGFDRTPGAAFLMPSDLPSIEPSNPEESAPRVAAAASPQAAPPVPERRTHERDPQDWRHRRRHERLQMFVAFHLQQVDEFGAVLAEERTVSENVSLGGARLKTNGHFCVGEVVVLRQASGAFETRAQVKQFTVEPDGGHHVGVMFLDAGPSHLVQSH